MKSKKQTSEELIKSVGSLIQEARKEQGKPQIFLGDQKHISDIEKGKVNLTLLSVHKLAAMLNKKVKITFE